MPKADGFIVMWDSRDWGKGEGPYAPCRLEFDNAPSKGRLVSTAGDAEPATLFTSRPEARRAIRRTAAWEKAEEIKPEDSEEKNFVIIPVMRQGGDHEPV